MNFSSFRKVCIAFSMMRLIFVLQPSIGTNPISVSAPGRAGDSFQLDMATSAVALGKVCPCHLTFSVKSGKATVISHVLAQSNASA